MMLSKSIRSLVNHAGHTHMVLGKILADIPPSDARRTTIVDLLKDIFDRLPPENNQPNDWWVGNHLGVLTIFRACAKHGQVSIHWHPVHDTPGWKPTFTAEIPNMGIMEDIDPSNEDDRAGFISMLISILTP